MMPWGEIKPYIKHIASKYYDVLTKIGNVDDCEVIIIRYPFGSTITKRGQFLLNLDGKLMPWRHKEVPEKIQNLLHYFWSGLPLGIVLDRGFESLIDTEQMVVSNNALLERGMTFAAWSVFEDINNQHIIPNAFTIYSGCRNLFSLPSLGDMQFGYRLAKKYGFRPIYPKTNWDQKELLDKLSTYLPDNQQWYCTVAFFTAKMVDKIRHSDATRASLLTGAWNYTGFMRNQYVYEFLWSDFITRRVSPNLKNRTHVVENAKNILKVMLGQAPAFTPCSNDMAGPIRAFTQMIVEDYKIRYYFPIFMRVDWYKAEDPVYYSLQHPTLHCVLPHKPTQKQALADLENIIDLIEMFKEEVEKNQLAFTLENTKLLIRLKNTRLEFFHCLAKDNSRISNDIESVFTSDIRFRKLHKIYNTRQLDYPKSSLFFNGMIKFSPIEEEYVMNLL